MATVQQILDRLKEVSGQVSAQTRTLALGFLGISWALLTAHDEPLRTMALHVNRLLILALACFAILVIAFDLLQYVAATAVADEAFDRAEKSEEQEALFLRDSFAYQAQAFLYHSKFCLLAVGALLLAIIFIGLFRAPSPPPSSPTPTTCQSTPQKISH
jgi:hypothetical protein